MDAVTELMPTPAVGDRYKQSCLGSPVWEISMLFCDDQGIEHVQLREVSNRLDLKTLALGAFLGSDKFRKLYARG